MSGGTSVAEAVAAVAHTHAVVMLGFSVLPLALDWIADPPAPHAAPDTLRVGAVAALLAFCGFVVSLGRVKPFSLHPTPANLITVLRTVLPLATMAAVGRANANWVQAAAVSVVFVGCDLLDGPLARMHEDVEARKAAKLPSEAERTAAADAAEARQAIGALLDMEADALGMYALSLIVSCTVWKGAILVGLLRYIWVVSFPGRNLKDEEKPDEPGRGRMLPMILAAATGAGMVLSVALQSQNVAMGSTAMLVYSFASDFLPSGSNANDDGRNDVDTQKREDSTVATRPSGRKRSSSQGRTPTRTTRRAGTTSKSPAPRKSRARRSSPRR